MRTAAVISGSEIVNVVVIPEGPEGDDMLFDTFVEITGLDPKPSLNAGWSYVNGAFVPPNRTWDGVREERDRLLVLSDWTQTIDAPVDQVAWAGYRQALRDIPQTYASPDDVVWPETP